MSGAREEFFIGWSRSLGPRLRRFLLAAAIGVPCGALALACLLGTAADDPAGADFARPPGIAAGSPLPVGDVALEGVLALAPYPLLHLPADAAHPRGRAVLLSGDGKYGAAADPALAGQRVTAQGFLLSRGSIDMLVLGRAPVAAMGEAPPPMVTRLGRWRISGEICDGKCASGVMRPGTGLAHRACAVLCLDGELPAILVATAPVEGSAFLLLGDAGGGPMAAALRPLVGLRVTLEGEVERRGDVLVLLADPARAGPVR